MGKVSCLNVNSHVISEQGEEPTIPSLSFITHVGDNAYTELLFHYNPENEGGNWNVQEEEQAGGLEL